MWANAHNQFITQKPHSHEDGWELINDVYEMVMFLGPPLPDSMISIPEEESILDDSEAE